MELSGPALLALALVVLGYLVPQLVRRREIEAVSRAADRFSENLRLVDVESLPPAADNKPEARVRVYDIDIAQRRTEAIAMIRPTAPVDQRANARELALARAALAAEVSRRRAAARRRFLLLSSLALVAVIGWVFVARGTLGWYVPILPTLLAGFLTYLGIQQYVADKEYFASAESDMARLDQRLVLFRSMESHSEPVARSYASFDELVRPYLGAHAEPGSAVSEPPRHARASGETELFLDLGESTEITDTHALGSGEGGWLPVPVPVPTYTLKAEVPRREVRRYEDAEVSAAPVPERPTAAAPVAQPAETAATFDLEAALSRRRAAGA